MRGKPHAAVEFAAILALLAVAFHQQREQRRFDRRRQFGGVVLETHLVEVWQGQILDADDLNRRIESCAARQPVHHQQVKPAARDVPRERLRQDLRVREIIAKNDGAGRCPSACPPLRAPAHSV